MSPTGQQRIEIAEIAVLVLILALVISRAWGREYRGARLLVGPLLLIASGIALVTSSSNWPARFHPIDGLVVFVDLLDSLGLGIWRGVTVKLYRRNGRPWYRYRAATIGLWAAAIAIRIALSLYGAAHGASTLVTTDALAFMFGLTLLAQNSVIMIRQSRADASADADPADAAQPEAPLLPRESEPPASSGGRTPAWLLAAVFCGLAAAFVLIWLLTSPGGFFWPIFPILALALLVVRAGTRRDR